jgi:hypothetical protein
MTIAPTREMGIAFILRLLSFRLLVFAGL